MPRSVLFQFICKGHNALTQKNDKTLADKSNDEIDDRKKRVERKVNPIKLNVECGHIDFYSAIRTVAIKIIDTP